MCKGLEMDRAACWGRTQVLACGIQGPSNGLVGGMWRGWQPGGALRQSPGSFPAV